LAVLLEVKNLSVAFKRDGRKLVPVRDVSFSVPERGRVALVGESGCGKSLSSLSLMRLPPTDRGTISGEIKFTGKRIAYIFQNPSESLNPVMRIADQIAEVLPRAMTKKEKEAEIKSLIERTGLPDPERIAKSYPCELSGGQQQRCMIAMALASKPDLLVADEPTTALDVTTQKQVISLIDELARETGMAVLFITHNLGLVAGCMDEVNVMYAGSVVESGKVTDVLKNPKHPYTKGLLAAIPKLDAPRDVRLADIPGTVPPPDKWPKGCAFAPRCPIATEECKAKPPPLKKDSSHLWCCCK
jgi:oligopeptide/dipeptide ABC transporter ATP-binding protein